MSTIKDVSNIPRISCIEKWEHKDLQMHQIIISDVYQNYIGMKKRANIKSRTKQNYTMRNNFNGIFINI